MVRVYITEHRYGDSIPDTYNKKEFQNFEGFINWIDSMDNSRDKVQTHLLCKMNNRYGISIDNNTRTWGAIYMYSITRIETEEGIHYDSSIEYNKCSKELEDAIDGFVKRVKCAKKVLF